MLLRCSNFLKGDSGPNGKMLLGFAQRGERLVVHKRYTLFLFLCSQPSVHNCTFDMFGLIIKLAKSHEHPSDPTKTAAIEMQNKL